MFRNSCFDVFRFLPGRPQPSAGIIQLVILSVLVLAPATAWTQGADFYLTTTGGYDDDVLADPGDARTFPVIEDGFLQLSPSVVGLHSPGSWILSASYAWVFNVYSQKSAGVYHQHVGAVSIGRALTPSLQVHVEGTGQIFRRGNFSDFDLDAGDVAPRVEWRPAVGWTLEAGARFGRIHYTDRLTVSQSDSPVLQNDDPFTTGLTATWRPVIGQRLRLDVEYLDTNSNQAQSIYDGFRLAAEGRTTLGGNVEVNLELAYERRDYPKFTVVRLAADGFVRRRVPRRDDSTFFELLLRRPIQPRLSAFTGISLFDYDSEAVSRSFDETTIRAGLEFHFGGVGRESALSFPDISTFPKRPRMPLAPRLEVITADRSARRVQFRHRAPNAGRVFLVGTFNDWVEDHNPMSDPDGDGIWEARIDLDPGTYRYMFLVDTEWKRPDDADLYEDDGFGMENGVLEVR